MTNWLHFEGYYTQLQRVGSEGRDVWLSGSPLGVTWVTFDRIEYFTTST